MIKEVVTFIKDKTAGLVIDTNIFAGHRPQGVADACDVVLETTGGEVFPELPERADPVFQVLSRAKTYFKARARSYAIYDAIYRDWIYGSAGFTLPVVDDAYEAMIIEPLAPPQYIGQDEKLRFEFSTNYIFKIREV